MYTPVWHALRSLGCPVAAPGLPGCRVFQVEDWQHQHLVANTLLVCVTSWDYHWSRVATGRQAGELRREIPKHTF